jgi:hypothetical protein
VENNELYAVMEKLGDGNAIYVSGAGDGNIIRRNYIHHCEECEMVSAIRTDDFQRETQITGNIIYKCCGGGIILKHKNYIEENIIADLQPVTNPDGTKTPPSVSLRVNLNNILVNNLKCLAQQGFQKTSAILNCSHTATQHCI